MAFGLFGAPAAWFAQINANYGLSSHACYPRQSPLPSAIPAWQWIWGAMPVLNLLAIFVSLSAIAVAWWNWRRTAGEERGGQGALIESGLGRTRFLSIWGFWGGLWFLLAIIANTIAVFWGPSCGG